MHLTHRAVCAKGKDNDAAADIGSPESRQRKRPVTEDRQVAQPASGNRQSRRKGLKAVLPIEDNGSFASLLNAFSQPEVASEQDDPTTEK
jgi:hypothetical protein